MSALERLVSVDPADIERRSFEIIGRELGDRVLDPENEPVIKRCIHTAADFDYADNLAFSPHATAIGAAALGRGASIVTDTSMAAFGGEVLNFIADPRVAAEARERGLTRSAVSMEFAARLSRPFVFAIGNAPTALVSLYELIEAGRMVRPHLIVGVPVGFVNVVESKELIMELDVPYIVARGRKGGSNVAAAICNALLYIASGGERQ